MNRAPRPVRRAAALTAVEGAALLAVSLGYLIRVLAGHPADRGTALSGAAMGLAGALLLLGLAAALARQRRPALAPVVLTQLLALPIAYGFLTSRQYLVGAVTAGLALGVLGLLFGAAAARDAFR